MRFFFKKNVHQKKASYLKLLRKFKSTKWYFLIIIKFDIINKIFSKKISFWKCTFYLYYQKNAYKKAVIIQIAKAEILNVGLVLKSFLVILIPFGSSAFPSNLLTIKIINIVAKHVINIWFIKGMSWLNNAKLDQPFGPTLKYIAIGIEEITSEIAPLLLAFL